MARPGVARRARWKGMLEMKTLAGVLVAICLSSAVLMAGGKAGGHKGGPVAAVSSLPNPLGFPDTAVGDISAIQTATFYNVGQAPLYFTQFQVPPDFAIVQNTCVTYVPVGQTCTISFVFRPTRSGIIGEDLYIFGNMNYVYVQGLIGKGI